ncbi:MAG: endopeptidase La, partial [Clostridiales bacterium]|nr:endopeptidase La [Clostridiales bacterium]
ILTCLTREIEILEIEKEIHLKVNEQIDKNQRDYYIREQMRVLSKELGEENDVESDLEGYVEKIAKLNLSEETFDKLNAEVKRLSKMSPASQEAVVIRSYLDTCLDLPWNTATKDNVNIKKAEKILDKDHYGMTKVKERILETLSVKALSPDVKGQILCLYGPPGVGKTSIGKSIAESLGRKYVRVSLGGVKDESDIRGHRKTYVGAMPGRIINAMKLAGTKNPVMLLDEIDKMSNDFKGDPSSAMLEVLDSEQNKEFRDHYIELPFDLSDVLFITTANNLDTIQPPLLDRMEVIELSSYTREEKFQIAKRHLISKQIDKNGLKKTQIRINDDAIYEIIDSYTREAGVRKLERTIGTLCRKAAKKIVENEVKRVTFKADNLGIYLGAKRYKPETYVNKTEIGTVNGLAWTSVGGVIMPLEVLVLDGKGKVELTGSLGDVMKESAKIAVSYVRSVAEKYGIPSDYFEKKDIHIHAPEGAVPKDGPSAGVTLATALISAITGIPVRSDVAMTGEITLRSKVLAIGGLREKTMAAYRFGINTVIIPAENKGDMEDVEDVVKNSINFVFAETISDVLEVALLKGCGGKTSVPVSMLSNTVENNPLHIAVGN